MPLPYLEFPNLPDNPDGKSVLCIVNMWGAWNRSLLSYEKGYAVAAVEMVKDASPLVGNMSIFFSGMLFAMDSLLDFRASAG